MKKIDVAMPQAVRRAQAWRGLWAGLLSGLVLMGCGGGGGGGADPAPVPPVPPSVVAPSIGTQPADAKVVDGATTTFSVAASGSSLSYQWQRDGKNIAGATGASYTTPVLRMADNGARFQVVVSGPNTSVTSNAVTLTVTPIALSLTAQPQAQTARDGEVATFDVAVTGSEPIQYQWYRNDAPIVGADKASYTTSALALADSSAVFKVVVTNPAGTLTSQDARLTVTAVAPRIVTAPESVTSSDGSTVTFKVVAAGSAPLAYQWLRNGSPIAGATDANVAVTLAYAGSGDRYAVRVSNTAGQVTSDAAIATVNAAAPSISRHPADVSIATGGTATFSTAASGTAPLRYQWQQSVDEGLSWSDIGGATAASHTIANATLADANLLLRVNVSNASAALTSNAARLKVQANVRILAGSPGGMGYADGKGTAARFGYVSSLGADASGNLYVPDLNNSVIRRIAPDGTVSLLAGKVLDWRRVDGALADARFVFPSDVTVDRNGVVYVYESCAIRRIANGVVSTLAGDGICRTVDGAPGQAFVAQVMGMTVDADGNVYFTERTDGNGQVVRRMSATGAVSTLVGSLTATGKADGQGSAARFSSIGKLVMDASKNLYVADGTAIRLVTPAGDVSYFAGAPDSYGQGEGYRTSARFGYISSLAVDGRGNLFVADGQRIARISTLGNVVTAVGAAYGREGYPTSVDGAAGVASAGNPTALVGLPGGGIAFFDNMIYAVRTLAADASVATLAGGGRPGGFADGVGGAGRFGGLAGYRNALVLSPSGAVILSDTANRRIRRLALDTRLLDTLAGSGTYGFDDGAAAAATFGNPVGLAYDAAGNLYIGDGGLLRRLGTGGAVTTVAGKPYDWSTVDGYRDAARLSAPGSIVVDSKGQLILAENSCTLRRVTPEGMVSTIAGKANTCGYVNGTGSDARLGAVKYLVIDREDNVYFTDGNHAIRKMTASGEVSTVAGAPYSAGLIDDIGAFSRFNNPSGLAFDSRGNLYVADTGNNAIRRISPGGFVTTVLAGSGQVSVLQPGLGGNINQPSALAVTPAGRLIFISEGAIVGD
jgi:sugar lactone lactonase YvrE